MEVIFWICVGLVVYVYAGYPVTLLLLPARRHHRQPVDGAPTVTTVIAAFNEVDHIAETVANKINQRFPPDRLDVLVVSDGSTDGTDQAVEALQEPRAAVLHQDPRQGKTIALNRALATTNSEVVVFSDANSQYEPDAILRLAAEFADPSVGYVTGRLIYKDPGEEAVGGGSGLYMRYENWLRRLETRVGSVVGVNGGIDAIRKRLYTPMRAEHLPDFVLPLRVVEQGYRVVYCQDAVSHEVALGRAKDEFRMRVRVSLRALNTLWEMRGLLHPRYGLFAFQLLIHKVLRYLVVLAMGAVLVTNVMVARSSFYRALLLVQCLFYALALVGWLCGGRVRLRAVLVPFYLCLINLAAGAALIRFLRRQHVVLWTPRKGA